MRAQKREKVSDRPKERKENIICAHIKYSSANNLSNNNVILLTTTKNIYIVYLYIHLYIYKLDGSQYEKNIIN